MNATFTAGQANMGYVRLYLTKNGVNGNSICRVGKVSGMIIKAPVLIK